VGLLWIAARYRRSVPAGLLSSRAAKGSKPVACAARISAQKACLCHTYLATECVQEREKSALDEWMRRQAASTVLHLEDAAGLSARRKDEGCVLAEAGRFHEAAGRFQVQHGHIN
jgi:hypothetical protein